MFNNINSIKVVEGCSTSSLSSEILESSIPLHLKGLASGWPAVELAQGSGVGFCRYASRFYRGAPINAAYGVSSENKRVFYNDDLSGFNYERKRVTLIELCKQILEFETLENAPVRYIDSALLDQVLPGFRSENDLLLEGLNPRVGLWVGNRTIVAPHFDTPNNIACVITGRRRFTLFPPDQIENLYVGPLDYNPGGAAISLVDMQNPDFKKHPRFKDALAHAQVAELGPGDAIYIPSMWWHSVEGLEGFNSMVNYWWETTPKYLGVPLDALFHSLLSIKGRPIQEKQHWKKIFEYYVFDSNSSTFDHIPDERKGVLDELDEVQARRLRGLLLKFLNC